jgi:hypothetical protein
MTLMVKRTFWVLEMPPDAIAKRRSKSSPAALLHASDGDVGSCKGPKGTPVPAPAQAPCPGAEEADGVVAGPNKIDIFKELAMGKSIVEVPMQKEVITATQLPCREDEVQMGKCMVEDKQEMTSLVVRNIPECYTREDLMLEWPNDNCAIDLLYMPQKNKGQTHNIAFINFSSNAAARAFRSHWHRQHLSHGVGDSTQQHLNIDFAKVQGQTAILSMLKKRRVGRLQSRYQPILFQSGVRMSLGNTLAATDKQTTAGSQHRSVAIEPFQAGGNRYRVHASGIEPGRSLVYL